MTDWQKSLTTEKGCFNCAKYPCGRRDEIKKQDLKIWQTDPLSGKKFAYGCCCTDYELDKKEQVQFT